MKFGPILRLRCPKCLRGDVFKEGRWFQMHTRCPECDLLYEREPGFFLGAMYFSYALGVVVALPVSGTLFFKYDWSAGAATLTGSLVTVLATPWIVRVSRVAWMHFDQSFDPR